MLLRQAVRVDRVCKNGQQSAKHFSAHSTSSRFVHEYSLTASYSFPALWLLVKQLYFPTVLTEEQTWKFLSSNISCMLFDLQIKDKQYRLKLTMFRVTQHCPCTNEKSSNQSTIRSMQIHSTMVSINQLYNSHTHRHSSMVNSPASLSDVNPALVSR